MAVKIQITKHMHKPIWQHMARAATDIQIHYYVVSIGSIGNRKGKKRVIGGD